MQSPLPDSSAVSELSPEALCRVPCPDNSAVTELSPGALCRVPCRIVQQLLNYRPRHCVEPPANAPQCKAPPCPTPLLTARLYTGERRTEGHRHRTRLSLAA